VTRIPQIETDRHRYAENCSDKDFLKQPLGMRITPSRGSQKMTFVAVAVASIRLNLRNLRSKQFEPGARN
jgi:hypothetical protein